MAGRGVNARGVVGEERGCRPPGAVSDEHERDVSGSSASSSGGSAVNLSWEETNVVAEPATKPTPPAKERGRQPGRGRVLADTMRTWPAVEVNEDGPVRAVLLVEPICRTGNFLLALFRIKHPDPWDMYKKTKASFSTVEEVGLNQVRKTGARCSWELARCCCVFFCPALGGLAVGRSSSSLPQLL